LPSHDEANSLFLSRGRLKANRAMWETRCHMLRGANHHIRSGLTFLLLLTSWSSAHGQRLNSACADCPVWNAPQAPFEVYGNTYYVGPHGLTSILITSDAGHVLIDGALPESVSQIVANIHALGFRIEDVKLIVNSHVHFDHAGGIAELQRLSGARVLASKWSAAVMTGTGAGRDDPQYGVVPPIARVAHVRRLRDGESFYVGQLEITAHLTPGHTPGGTSWTWKSCDGGRCLDLVYADSLTPVSAQGFKFTAPEHPRSVKDFERSFAFLKTAPCDILLTPHPDASGLWQRLDARRQGTVPDPMIDPSACRQLAERTNEQLRKRIAAEAVQ
jgi:metallo-beta-lactamase class B